MWTYGLWTPALKITPHLTREDIHQWSLTRGKCSICIVRSSPNPFKQNEWVEGLLSVSYTPVVMSAACQGEVDSPKVAVKTSLVWLDDAMLGLRVIALPACVSLYNHTSSRQVTSCQRAIIPICLNQASLDNEPNLFLRYVWNLTPGGISSKFGTNGHLDSRMNRSEFEWSKVKFTVVKHLVKKAFLNIPSQLFHVLVQEKQLDLVHRGVQQGSSCGFICWMMAPKHVNVINGFWNGSVR